MKTPKRGKDIKTQASEYISLYTHAHKEKKKKNTRNKTAMFFLPGIGFL